MRIVLSTSRVYVAMLDATQVRDEHARMTEGRAEWRAGLYGAGDACSKYVYGRLQRTRGRE